MSDDHENLISPGENLSDEESGGNDEQISIQEFINRKRLQNRVLGEIIEKMKGQDQHPEITESNKQPKKNNP